MRHRQVRDEGWVGFTTIELMMTLVIVGVVAAFGYPSIAQQLRHTRVNQASQIVAADLELAASIAAKRQQPIVFEGRATEYLATAPRTPYSSIER